MKALRWFYLLPIYPLILLLNEIEKFGKYIRWGRIDLETAYKIGFESGRDKSRVEFNLMFNQLKIQVEESANKLVETYKGSLKIIEVREARDFYSGEVLSEADLVTIEPVCIQMCIKPEHQCFVMPPRFRIRELVMLASESTGEKE